MYKVTVTATDKISATASKQCRTKREAENIRKKLKQVLKMPVQIDIVYI